MNKNVKLSVLLATLSLVMAGCTKPTPTPLPPDPPEPPVTDAWSDEVNAKTQEVLGHDLPYMDIGTYTFDFDDEYNVWEIYNTKSGSRAEEILAYNELLKTLDDYELLEADVDEEEGSYYYAYMKTIEETETKLVYNYVDVQGFVSEGTGYFYIDFNRYEEETIVEWTDEEKEAMNSFLGFVLPIPEAGLPSTTKLSCDEEEGLELYVTTDFDTASALFAFYDSFLLTTQGFDGESGTDSYGDYAGSYSKVLGTTTILEEEFNSGLSATAAAQDWTGYEDYGYSTFFGLSFQQVVFSKQSESFPSAQLAKVLGETKSEVVPFENATNFAYQYVMIADEEDEEAEPVLGISISFSATDEAFSAYLEALLGKAYLISDLSSWAILIGYAPYLAEPWYGEFELEMADYLDGTYEFLFVPTGDEVTPYKSLPLTLVNETLGIENDKLIPGVPSSLVDETYGYIFYGDKESKAAQVMFVDNGSGEDLFMNEYANMLAVDEFDVTPLTSEDEETEEEVVYGYKVEIEVSEEVGSVVMTIMQQGMIVMITYQIKAPLPSSIDFSDDSQLVSASDDLATWEFAHGTMSVAKGASSLVVGGQDQQYIKDPLRIYAKQVITFEFDEGYVPSQIVFETNRGASDLANATIVGGTATVSGSTVTLTLDAEATSVTITVAAQVRLTSLELVYVA